MRVKIDVFSGFLGAGKTMLIKKLVSENLYKEKIVIIENEFGEVGIDGTILKKSNIDVKEINGGCICCTVASDFSKAIKEVIEKFNPQRIIIEPSGVGKLSDVLRVCKDEEIKKIAQLNMVITVIDGMKFDIYVKNFAEFYRNQIQNAKVLVISRTQKLSVEKVITICEALRKLNPNTSIITTPWDEIKSEKIIEIGESSKTDSSLMKINLLKRPFKVGTIKEGINTTANDVFQTVGFETPKQFSISSIEKILNSLEQNKNCGVILRAKGIVQTNDKKWMQFDYVPEEFQVRETTADYTGRVCVIGSNIDKERIKTLFS
jgi:G3E family GTPase